MITKEQAIKLAESKFWESMSYREIAEFQLNTECLCMPFEIFHEVIEKTLDRPVGTHEFASLDILKKRNVWRKATAFNGRHSKPHS